MCPAPEQVLVSLLATHSEISEMSHCDASIPLAFLSFVEMSVRCGEAVIGIVSNHKVRAICLISFYFSAIKRLIKNTVYITINE